MTDTISRYPETGAIFLQIGPMFVTPPGDLYARYPGLTIAHTGPIGYTGSYRDRDTDIAAVSMVAVLEARGPD